MLFIFVCLFLGEGYSPPSFPRFGHFQLRSLVGKCRHCHLLAEPGLTRTRRDAGCGGMRDAAGCCGMRGRGGRSTETRSRSLSCGDRYFLFLNGHLKTPPGCRFINTCPIIMLILFLASPSPPIIPLLSQQTIIFYY